MKEFDFEQLLQEVRKVSLGLRFPAILHVGGIDVSLDRADVVGNIMQEWMEGWFKKNGVAYAINDNTQMPPDFFLDPMDKRHHLLEIKAFNYKAGPGFDIADFKMYGLYVSLGCLT